MALTKVSEVCFDGENVRYEDFLFDVENDVWYAYDKRWRVSKHLMVRVKAIMQTTFLKAMRKAVAKAQNDTDLLW